MNKKGMLEQLIMYYEEGSKTRFARRLGISPQGVSTWLSRGTIDYELIYAKCENINADWLLSGEGPMLRADGEPTLSATSSTDTSTPSDTVILRLMDKLDEKDAENKHLQSELRQQSAELAALKARYPEEPADNPAILKTAKPASTKKSSSPNADNAPSANAR